LTALGHIQLIDEEIDPIRLELNIREWPFGAQLGRNVVERVTDVWKRDAVVPANRAQYVGLYEVQERQALSRLSI
jgi:hypothetical protein